jgi:hypothetical protein
LFFSCSPSYLIYGRNLRHVCRENSAYKLLWTKGRTSLGIPRRKWEDNIKINVQEIALKKMHCFQVAKNRGDWMFFVNTMMNHRFHKIPVIS